MWFRLRPAASGGGAAVPKVCTISSPSMRTAVMWPRIRGGGIISCGSMMKSFSSTVTPCPGGIFTMSSISMPNSFISGLMGSPRLLIDLAWMRSFPSGVTSTAPLTLKGMSIFLSSLPFSLTTPSSTLMSRSLMGAFSSPKTYLFMRVLSAAWSMAVSPPSTSTTYDSLRSRLGGAPGRVGTNRPRSAWTWRVTSSVKCRSTLRMSTSTDPVGVAADAARAGAVPPARGPARKRIPDTIRTFRMTGRTHEPGQPERRLLTPRVQVRAQPLLVVGIDAQELDADPVTARAHRVAALHLGLDPHRLAVELQREIVDGADLEGRGQVEQRPAQAEVDEAGGDLRPRGAGHGILAHAPARCRSRSRNDSSSARSSASTFTKEMPMW